MPHTSKRQQQPEVIKPQDFYRGYNATWEPLEQDLDVRRGVSDDTLEDVFLLDDYTERKPREVVLLRVTPAAVRQCHYAASRGTRRRRTIVFVFMLTMTLVRISEPFRN